MNAFTVFYAVGYGWCVFLATRSFLLHRGLGEVVLLAACALLFAAHLTVLMR